jgi:hypothetical protein
MVGKAILEILESSAMINPAVVPRMQIRGGRVDDHDTDFHQGT